MAGRVVAWASVLALAFMLAQCDWKLGLSALPSAPVRSPVLDLLPADPQGCAERGC